MARTSIRTFSCLRVEALTDDTQFDSLRQQWDELLDESDQCVFFLRWDWNRLWWRVYAPPHSRLSIIVCRDECDRLVGLAAFYWRRQHVAGITSVRELFFLGTGVNLRTSEDLDIISLRGYEQAVAETIAAFLRQSDQWDRLWLWGIPAASKVLPHFHRALGADVRINVCDQSHCVDTRSDWNSVKAGFSLSHRREIDKEVRRVFRRHVCEFRRIDSLEHLNHAMDELVRLHQARWKRKGEPGSFALPDFISFMHQAMKFSLRDGRLRAWMLYLDRRCVAVKVAFVDHGVAYSFKSGFDPAYEKLSLGSVMQALCIRDCIQDERIHEFNLMGGADGYKDSWTSTTRESVELELLRSSFRSRIYITCLKARQVFVGLCRTVVPLGHRKWIRAHLPGFRFRFSRFNCRSRRLRAEVDSQEEQV